MRIYENRSVVTCDQCGFLFVLDPKDSTVSESDISKTEARHTLIPTPRNRHYYIKKLIEERIGPTSSVLEIGAGYGALGKLLDHHGHNYLGFEPSTVRADIATEGGIDVVPAVYDPSEVDETFEAIVIDNVLEHVENPRTVVEQAVSSLDENGIVIVIVPSRRDLRRLHPQWNESNFWVPNVHINFFRLKDLERLYSVTGLQMKPFPPTSFGLQEPKDIAFTLKSLVEQCGIYPLSLYTYGTKSTS